MIAIYLTESVSFPYGGQAANNSEGPCLSDTDQRMALYHSVVIPWAVSKVMGDRTITHLPSDIPSLRRPGIVIIGGDPAKDNYPVKYFPPYEMKVKAAGTHKQFEEAKRLGKIVLKPYFAVKISGNATPNLYPTRTWITADNRANFSLYEAETTWLSACSPGWTLIPGKEVVSFGNSCAYKMKGYGSPVVTPVDDIVIRSLREDIISHLSREIPNGTLVTNTVAEANSATFDIATEIGEMPETIGMILNGIKQGILLLLRAKREIKQKLSSGTITTDAASLWMQYRYGLMPIVYSINDGLDLLELETKKFQTFRGRSDSPAKKFNARGYTCVSSPDVQHRCFLKYGYDVNSKIHQGLKINIASTAWELIPLSFVFDWFFQVGDYLTARFTPGVVDQIGCLYSYRVNGEYVFRNETGSTITYTVDYYRADVIKPDSFIGVNSELFTSFKRSMDALSLSWLLFKKKSK